MKRILLIILLTFFALLFISCDVDLTQSTNTKYQLSYECLDENKDMLYSYPEAGLYASGTELVIKVHTVTDCSLHVYLNKEDLQKSEQEKIDRYYVNVFKFNMPENDVVVHLTFDQFYGKDEYSFSDVNWQVRYLENNNASIDHIKLSLKDDNEYFNKHIYTSDETALSSLLDLFNQKLTRAKESVDFNNMISYYLFNENNYVVVEVNIIDNCVLYQDFSSSELFKLPNNYELPIFTGEETYTFRVPYANNAKVKVYKGNEMVSNDLWFDSFSMYEFIPISKSELGETNVFYKVETPYGDIEILSYKRFFFNGQAYEIVGETDFSYWRTFVIE